MTKAVELAQVASNGVSEAFKNRIINGAMVIDQRNAGASFSSSANGAYNLDRWYNQNNSSGTRFTVQQNAGSVTPPAGFRNYLGVTSTSAYSVASTDVLAIGQKIEGFNTADLMWGTANAQTITVSFWVRSSLTGTFGGSVSNNDGNRFYAFTYTISAANTWEYKTVTLTGDTTGTWNTTTGAGIQLLFNLGTGATFSGTAGSWTSSAFYAPTGAVSVVGTNGATWYVTGVQLEVGSSATSFETRQYTTELQLCQRYFYIFRPAASAAGPLCPGAIYNSSVAFGNIMYPTTMRTNATLGLSPASVLQVFANGAGYNTTNTIIGGETTAQAVELQILGSGFPSGSGGFVRVNAGASNFISFSAEL